MLKENLENALNEQFNYELYSSHLYLAMAAYLEAQNIAGGAHWFRMQAEEEKEHAMKFYEFIYKRQGKVEVAALDQPKGDYASFQGAFSQALEHERSVTRRIHDLYTLASDEQDYAAEIFLQWFVSEQVEEEKTLVDIIGKLNFVGDDKHALLALDKELGSR